MIILALFIKYSPLSTRARTLNTTDIIWEISSEFFLKENNFRNNLLMCAKKYVEVNEGIF